MEQFSGYIGEKNVALFNDKIKKPAFFKVQY